MAKVISNKLPGALERVQSHYTLFVLNEVEADIS